MQTSNNILMYFTSSRMLACCLLIYLSLILVNLYSKKNLKKNLGYLSLYKYKYLKGTMIPEENLFFNLDITIDNVITLSLRLLRYSSLFISAAFLIIWFFLTSHNFIVLLSFLIAIALINLFHAITLKHEINIWQKELDSCETIVFEEKW